jgi:hypothetical protein
VKKIAWLLCAHAVATCGALQAAQTIGPKPEYKTFVDYAAPPETISALKRASDAAVRVTIRNTRPYQMDVPFAGAMPMTEHDAVVEEIFKSHPELPSIGTVISVIERAGSYETQERRVTSSEPSHMLVNGEYVLFLEWNSNLSKFEPMYGPNAIYRIVGSTVESFSVSKVAQRQHGRPTIDLLTELRNAPGR